MRKIKFRGKCIDSGKWVYGGFHKHQKTTNAPIIPKGEKVKEPEFAYLIIQSGFSDWNMPKPINAIEVLPETVGQYTGLKDRNGKGIYEGAIVRTTDAKYSIFDKKAVIEFYANSWCIDMSKIYPSREGWIIRINSETEMEVIGNIYDNSDLLGDTP